MNLEIRQDLWQYLRTATKPIVMYGMGNGADKILAVCQRYGIEIRDFFASDGFVRGHSFHGKRVLSYTEINEAYRESDCIVLLSFASSRPEVLSLIQRVASEHELYAPDVPVFGNTLFNMAFYHEHEADFAQAYALFEDEESRRVYVQMLRYKLSGDIRYLWSAEHSKEEVFTSLLSPEAYRAYADLGAYNGDTVRELLTYAPSLERVWAMEPDRRNFKKLSHYAEEETRCRITPIPKGAWNHSGTLGFDDSGNRNANLSEKATAHTVEVDTLDNVLDGCRVDYVKYDVEGAEYEALTGSRHTIVTYKPDLLVSAYHRSEDLFILPRLIKSLNPFYRLYLRRHRYVPAWDLNILAVNDKN